MAEHLTPSELEDDNYTLYDTSGAGSLHHSEGPEHEPERSCWICFGTEQDNFLASWVQPCQCRGTTKWVHQSCLYRWIDEKQKGNSRRTVVCQQCRTEYIIVFPTMNRLANALESMDAVIKRSSPYVAAGVFVGSIYWTAITYGAITVIQVMGHQRGLELMENGDPFFLLIGLPVIPVGLVLTRLIRWEDAVLRLIRDRNNVVRKLPLLNWLFTADPDLEDATLNTPAPPAVANEPVYISRLFCGAVLLPSISTMMGNLMFKSMEDPVLRTVLGGVVYIGLKGILKIYLRQKQYLRKKRRRIVDYPEDNVRVYLATDMNSEVSSTTGRPEGGSDDGDFDYDDDDDDDDDGDAEDVEEEEVDEVGEEEESDYDLDSLDDVIQEPRRQRRLGSSGNSSGTARAIEMSRRSI